MANQKYEAFLKVVETGSFKEAARELGYTQVIIAGRLPRRSTLSCHTVPRRAASC